MHGITSQITNIGKLVGQGVYSSLAIFFKRVGIGGIQRQYRWFGHREYFVFARLQVGAEPFKDVVCFVRESLSKGSGKSGHDTKIIYQLGAKQTGILLAQIALDIGVVFLEGRRIMHGAL